MKTLLQKTSFRIAACGILCLSLSFLLLANPGGENTGRYGPVGTWTFKAKLSQPVPPGFPPNGEFEGVETFNSDGTMYVVANLPGPTIGMGVWKSTGPARFTFTFTFYRPDPTSPLLLPVRVHENGKMTNGGANYETTDVIMPLDAAGNPLMLCGGPCMFPGTVKAARYEFAAFNTTLP